MARPVLIEAPTHCDAEFDNREFQKWTTAFDLPEVVIDKLARNQQRNDTIVAHYVENRKRYGKTIIFADRWFQCEYLREALQQRQIAADAIYSHIDADPRSAAARNRRTESENAEVLDRFRKGALDVLINVRMATEGTDIPDAQTVFLTRQTTSQILITQMAGRALRGPKFGGTPEAYIVSFIDNWKQYITFAAYDPLRPGEADERIPEYGKRPPMQLVSIDVVRRLARQLDSGINVNPVPYRTLLPVGWYLAEYSLVREGSEEVEPIQRLVMVFEGTKPRFERLIQALQRENLGRFQAETTQLNEESRKQIAGWREEYFTGADEFLGGDLEGDIFAIARHLAQYEQTAPRFFAFEARDEHDLDLIANEFVRLNKPRLEEDAALRTEYARQDRYWHIIYPNYDYFKSHYNGCVERILRGDAEMQKPVLLSETTRTEVIDDSEPSEEIKEMVKARDGYRCLCCGQTTRRFLRVDHIVARYYGVNHDLENLQTLCSICNNDKGIERIDFRTKRTLLTEPLKLPLCECPSERDLGDPEQWKMALQRWINFFYRCSAVNQILLGERGDKFRRWQVWLHAGNNAGWLEPYIPQLLEKIRLARIQVGYESTPEQITVIGKS